jgi:glycosyltransferase involved in cell wall biosynthesis
MPIVLRCFYQQTWPDLELVIICDGPERLDIPKDPRINYVHLDNKITTGAKRNLGARIATGDICAAGDDDDWQHPARIFDQVQRLQKTGKAVTGYYDTVIFDEKTGNLHLQKGGPPYYVSGTSQCYWKSWWEEHPFPDCCVGEDAVFGREARIADQLAAAPIGKMMVIRCHDDNTESRNLTWTPRLKREDVSPQFFLDMETKLVNIGAFVLDCCAEEAEIQFRAIVPDYKVTRPLPEIQTR